MQGFTARIVSMPSMELFDAQDEAYRESVLPRSIRARVAIEAGATFGWHKYVGLDGAVVGRDAFGASGPQATLFREMGFTPEHVAEVARRHPCAAAVNRNATRPRIPCAGAAFF